MMVVQKHKLTSNSDALNGGADRDLFLAPLRNGSPTLDDADILNGGKGVDTIRATLVDGAVAPGMLGIERGIFTTGNVSDTHIDLHNTSRMRDLVFRQNTDHASETSVYAENAAHVRSLSIVDAHNSAYSVSGLDTAAVRELSVSFSGAISTTLDLQSDADVPYRTLDIDLTGGADVYVSGNCIGADNVVVHSDGQDKNKLSLNPVIGSDAISNLTITGSQNVALYNMSGAYLHLKSFDSTAMSGITWATIGGSELQTVKGGAGAEVVDITSIGGSVETPATVELGGGNDYLTLKYALNSETQHYNGGGGTDTITLEGAANDLRDVAMSFEDVQVNHASGLYDVAGMKLVNFLLFSTSSAVTVDQLADNATLGIYTDNETSVAVNMVDAAASTSDSLRVLLQNSATLGSQEAGFMAADLSNLQIECNYGQYVMYLGTVGSSSAGAHVEISGDAHLQLHASSASTSYIATLTITDDAGVDISGLADGAKAFTDDGATILGGGGGDTLVGGNGSDTITTGAGSDMLIFDRQAQSSFGDGRDTVTDFGGSDRIDVSAIAGNLGFVGNFAGNTAGEAALLTEHASAFFNTSDHTLYIDLDHDRHLGAATDMAIHLNGVTSLDGAALLS